MSAEQTGAFFALVSVCSGLGSVLSLLLLLAKPVRERLFGLSAIPGRAALYAARGYAGGIL